MSDTQALNLTVGKLEGLVEAMEKDLENYRKDKKEVYSRLNSIEHKLDSMPTPEEWATLKALAKSEANKAEFWADLRYSMAKKGILAVAALTTIYFWDHLVLWAKSHMGG